MPSSTEGGIVLAIDRFFLRVTGKPYTRFRAKYALRLLLAPVNFVLALVLAVPLAAIEEVDYLRRNVPYWWRIVNGKALR